MDGDHRDLPRLSLRDELTVLRAQVRVVTDRRQGRHIEQPPRPAALDEAATLPRAGLPSNGLEACQVGCSMSEGCLAAHPRRRRPAAARARYEAQGYSTSRRCAGAIAGPREGFSGR